MRIFERLYLNGEWVPASSPGSIEVLSASTEEVMGRIPEGTPHDVDRAVQAAGNRFESWAATSIEERLRLLRGLAAGLKDRPDEIAMTITGGGGGPLRLQTIPSPGAPPAGKRVAEVAARTLKRVALELGGKSADVILEDADLPR